MSRLEYVGTLCLACCLVLLTTVATVAATPIRQLTSNTSAANVRPAWSPDGKRIAFQGNGDGPYHIYVMDADGSNLRQLTSGDADDRHPAWSPDGKSIAIDSGDATHREIWVIDVASRSRTQLTRLGQVTSFPSWSPDGKRISFYVYEAGAMDIWLIGADGAGQSRLTRDFATENNQQCTFACHRAAWSRDSSRLAVSDGDQQRVLLLSALTPSATRAISPEDERSHFPVYLADGRVVYVTEHLSLDQSWTDLWAVDPDAAGQRSEVAQGVLAQGPFELSSDGRELLFASPRTGNFEIYAVTLDAAGKAALSAKAQDTLTAPPVVRETGIALPPQTPYALALGIAALLLLGLEVRARLRKRGS